MKIELTNQDTAVLTAFERFNDACTPSECRKALHIMFAVFAAHNDATKERIEETAHHYQHLIELLCSLETIESNH